MTKELELSDQKPDLPVQSDNAPLPSVLYDGGLTAYMQSVNKIPLLSQEEEFLLSKNYLEHHDIESAHKLVRSHLKLVVKIALSYRNYGFPVIDLISEGNLGLMHAVKKFDPYLGNRLSTYAMWWIKAAIQEYILKSWSMVKLGTSATHKKLFFSLNKIKNRIRNANAREINYSDYEDIATELGVNTSDVIEIDRQISGGDVSLNDSVSMNGDNSAELIDYITESRPSHDVVLSHKQESQIKKKLLFEAIKTLNERELLIITERRLNDPATTLDDLSKRLDISKERVRQIEKRAFEKIQEYILERIHLV